MNILVIPEIQWHSYDHTPQDSRKGGDVGLPPQPTQVTSSPPVPQTRELRPHRKLGRLQRAGYASNGKKTFLNDLLAANLKNLIVASQTFCWILLSSPHGASRDREPMTMLADVMKPMKLTFNKIKHDLTQPGANKV